MTSGTYEEKLPCGGTLRVMCSNWEIKYYFSGPDLRYNGTFVEIPGNKVEEYVAAFLENFSEFEVLQKTIPKGRELSQSAKMGMTIRIGSFAQGVCLRSYHMPVATRHELQKVVDGYRYAMKRAPHVQKFLASL